MSACRFIALIRIIASSCSQIISAIGMPSTEWMRTSDQFAKNLALWTMAARVTARTSWMAFKTALAQLLDSTAEKISQVVRDED